MPSNVTCSYDRFAVTLMDMLDDVYIKLAMENPKVVAMTCKFARDDVKAIWGDHHFHSDAPKYADGFKYTTRVKNKNEAIGEVGNKTYPGLVHLLELGHAKVGGGRVNGINHMAKAAEHASDVYMKLAQEAVERALR